ncbi:MAG: hypothetical protein F4147_05660, partial [Gammaproteobacteria bacterium]|nr:hypothetical protein [Gammaproteobacteria bacterium]
LRAVRERAAEQAFREEIERLDEAHRQRLADNAAAATEENLILVDRLRRGAAAAFEEYGDAATAAADNAREAVNRSLQSMEDALVDFVTTGKLNFRELVDSILADLARLVIRQSITGPLSQALGGALGGLFPGATPGIGAGVPGNSIAGAPVFHGGGRAGDPSGRRRTGIDPALFLGAPRLHRGGLAGDEVPIIAQRGERVLSRAETADYDGMRQAPQVHINIDNRGAPVNAEVRNQRWDGRSLVVDVLLDDVSRRGPFTQGLQRTFGLREQAV